MFFDLNDKLVAFRILLGDIKNMSNYNMKYKNDIDNKKSTISSAFVLAGRR